MFPITSVHLLARLLGAFSKEYYFPYLLYSYVISENETKQIAAIVATYSYSVKENSFACYFLTYMYEYLVGLNPRSISIEAAMRNYERLADAGYGPAQDLLAFCYLHGFIVRQSIPRAEKMAKRQKIGLRKINGPSSKFTSAQKVNYLKLLKKIAQPETTDQEKLFLRSQVVENPFSTLDDKKQYFDNLMKAALHKEAAKARRVYSRKF